MPGEIVRVFEKYDQALNKSFLSNYKLSIQLSLDGFSFCIFDKDINRFVGLGSFSVQGNGSCDDFIEAFEPFFNGHEWLKPLASGIQVNILFEPEKSTLVPSSLFLNEEKKSYAQFNFPVHEDENVNTDELKNAGASILYTIPKQLKIMVDRLFPNCNLTCHVGILIEILLLIYKNQPTRKRMAVNVRQQKLDIIITEGKKLLFYNSFKYSSKEDFVYYIIFVIEQLNINPEEIDLGLCGLLGKESDIFDLIYKYIRNILFLKPSDNFSYSYVFSEVPGHFHFNLINSILCE